MTYEVQTRPATSDGQGNQAGLPGGWQALVTAAFAALLTIGWIATDRGTGALIGADSVSRLDEISPRDLSAALDTVAGTSQQLARFRDHDPCSHHLAWVTMVREPGRQSARIRLQSGTYISPAFELAETPVRVALPYPAPYATGNGVISVGATAAAIVALSPPWHVPARAGIETRNVTWTPTPGCARDSQ